MLSRTRYYYGKFSSHPDFYIMKGLGRFNTLRSVIPHVSNRHLSKPDRSPSSIFTALDVNEAVRDLKKDGLCTRIDLPKEIVNEIFSFAMNEYCYGDANPKYGFSYSHKQEAEAKIGKRFVVGRHFNTPARCQPIRLLERDPKLWEIAEGYLGTTPKYIGNQLWWSFAGERTHAEQNLFAQMFHYDLDDYAFLKLFFYITDVDEASGPHVYVRGSHRKKKVFHRLAYKRIPDEEVVGYYGEHNIITLQGGAGMGFAEDTYGLHKGLSPIRKDRLILQMQFAINDYGFQHDTKDLSLLERLV